MPLAHANVWDRNTTAKLYARLAFALPHARGGAHTRPSSEASRAVHNARAAPYPTKSHSEEIREVAERIGTHVLATLAIVEGFALERGAAESWSASSSPSNAWKAFARWREMRTSNPASSPSPYAGMKTIIYKTLSGHVGGVRGWSAHLRRERCVKFITLTRNIFDVEVSFAIVTKQGGGFLRTDSTNHTVVLNATKMRGIMEREMQKFGSYGHLTEGAPSSTLSYEEILDAEARYGGDPGRGVDAVKALIVERLDRATEQAMMANRSRGSGAVEAGTSTLGTVNGSRTVGAAAGGVGALCPFEVAPAVKTLYTR